MCVSASIDTVIPPRTRSYGRWHELSFPLPSAPVFPPGAGSFSGGRGAAELRSAWPLYDCDAKWRTTGTFRFLGFARPRGVRLSTANSDGAGQFSGAVRLLPVEIGSGTGGPLSNPAHVFHAHRCHAGVAAATAGHVGFPRLPEQLPG